MVIHGRDEKLPARRCVEEYLNEKRTCLAYINPHQQTHFTMSRVTFSKELISSISRYGYCFSIWHKLLVGVLPLAKTNIRRVILEELNTYQEAIRMDYGEPQ